MIRRAVQAMSAVPAVFDFLRWILEGGFRGHESVFQNELRDDSGTTLDLGCGTGQWSGRFAASEYVGVDIVPDYLSAARGKHPEHTFLLADGRSLPLKTESIKRVLISGVLHHLDDLTAADVLAECVRVLAPTGTLVVWEDIPTSPWTNPVGHLAHRLDNGDFIRPPDEYRRLLSADCHVASERTFRSGFMDYAVFVCAKPTC